MTGQELHRLFKRLADAGAPTGGAAFSALEVPGSGGHMVSLSATGTPGLLLSTAAGGVRPARIRLSGLDALFGVSCTVAVDGMATKERQMSILECTAVDDAKPLFAEFGGTFLRLVGVQPTMAQAAAAVARFAAIFSSLVRPSRQSVTGLIGELMLLLHAADPATAVACWRSAPLDRFDFLAPDARVECKAASLGLRLHSFSWEQCNPPDGPALAASLFVESAGGGTSVREMLDRIEARLSAAPGAAARLRETVASTMGASLAQALDARFDEAVCRNSLRWFDLRDVPAIRGDLPLGVGGVRFTSDLSSVQPVAPSRLDGTGLEALVPSP